MEFTPDITVYIAGMAVIFLAGMTQGLTGFGFSLVFVSIMLAFLPPRVVVPVVTVHATIINCLIVYSVRKHVDLKRIAPLMIAGIVGIPFGARVLLVIEGSLMKAVTGCLIALFAVAYLAGFERKVKNEKVAFSWIGFLSGFLNSSTGFSGPPVILFFANQRIPKDVFRANLALYFLVLNASTLVVYLFNGLLNVAIVKFSMVFLPGLAAGAAAGIALAGKVDDKMFRKLALVVVSVAGVIAALGGLGIFGR